MAEMNADLSEDSSGSYVLCDIVIFLNVINIQTICNLNHFLRPFISPAENTISGCVHGFSVLSPREWHTAAALNL
jgi:hypothetical protein